MNDNSYNIILLSNSSQRFIVDTIKSRFRKINVFEIENIEKIEKLTSVNNIDLLIFDIDGYEKIDIAEPILTIYLIKKFSPLTFANSNIDLDIIDYLITPVSSSQLIRKLKYYFNVLDINRSSKSKNIQHLQQAANEFDIYQEALKESDNVSKTDVNGIITYVNNKFCDVSGYSKEELIGKPHSIIRHPDTPSKVFKQLWAVIQNRQVFRGIIKNRRKDGTSYHVDSTVMPVLDNNGYIKEFIAIRHYVESIMNHKKLLKEVIDASSNPFLVLVKIEDFAELESFYNNETIEKIENNFLKKALSYFPDTCSFEKVYSLENGEFAFIKEVSSETTQMQQHALLKEFQREVKDDLFYLDGYEYDINVLVSFANHKEDIFDNVKLGMKELLQTKASIIYSNNLVESARSNAKKNIDTIIQIKDAINTDNIVSYFQPLYNNSTQEIDKYESLVRLIDDGKVISPYFFLNTSKKGKYYSQITEIVLRKSFEALRKTDKQISINISSLDIENDKTRKQICDLLNFDKSYGTRIVFELLEDEMVKDFKTIKSFITHVKQKGVKIAIDDFGSGYSNFERLLDFQPDILKIDGSLIKNIVHDRYSRHIVETIQNFATKEGIKTVAEFVSSKEIFEIVKEIGIDYSQGYFFGEPKELT
ncbi:MAG: EAL domain-containing protein [Campylobacterota bacterium]|nr:EAL domain-containing protein [Campylobacterota bacterium]